MNKKAFILLTDGLLVVILSGILLVLILYLMQTEANFQAGLTAYRERSNAKLEEHFAKEGICCRKEAEVSSAD